MNVKNGTFFIISFLMLAGCAAINMNHYQDGKALGKNEMDGFIGVGTGLSFHTDTTKIGENAYEVETKKGPSPIFLNISIRAGVLSKLDLGGEIFTTIGSTGFKLFSKYELTDTLSRWGVALMPLIGFSFPWFDEEDEDEEDINTDDEIKISDRSFIFEVVAPMSYAFSDNITLAFGPKVYIHHNFINQTGGKSADLDRKGKQTWFSPGAFLGIHISKFRFEGSLVYLDRKVWMPYFGMSFTPSQLIGDSNDETEENKEPE